MGLTDAEFRSLDPAQWAALVQRWQWRERRADARAALVAAVIANVNRDPDERPEPFELDDFTPLLAILPRRPAWLDERAPVSRNTGPGPEDL